MEMDDIPLMPEPDSELAPLYWNCFYRFIVKKKHRRIKRLVAHGNFERAKHHYHFWKTYNELSNDNSAECGRHGLLTLVSFYSFLQDAKANFPIQDGEEDEEDDNE